MSAIIPLALHCPCCNGPFQSRTLKNLGKHSAKYTDFNEFHPVRNPLPFLIHTCSCCGYSGYESHFSATPDSLDFAVRSQVQRKIQLNLGTTIPTASEKFEFAAWCSEFRGESPRIVADFFQRAAWCCILEGDTEAERYFRGLAANTFMDALAQFDGVEVGERAVLTYLVGENFRRMGHLKLSHQWFRRVQEEVIDRGAQKWLIDLASQQAHRPREFFG